MLQNYLNLIYDDWLMFAFDNEVNFLFFLADRDSKILEWEKFLKKAAFRWLTLKCSRDQFDCFDFFTSEINKNKGWNRFLKRTTYKL